MLGRDLLMDVDFAGMYAEQSERSAFGSRTSGDWDVRAERRNRGEGGGSGYTRQFLERVNWEGVESALDVGCGTGNLAIPLAQRLAGEVHALDFSAEMLRYLEENRQRAGVENLRLHRLAWADSWEAVPEVDLVVCSRALNVTDLRAALEKLHGKARRRVMLTIHAGGSFLGGDVLELLEREMAPRPDYMYAVNVLYQMGIRAKVDFLESAGGSVYGSREEFLQGIRWRIGELSAVEEERLAVLHDGLPEAAGGGGRKQYRHDFTWALLSWERGG